MVPRRRNVSSRCDRRGVRVRRAGWVARLSTACRRVRALAGKAPRWPISGARSETAIRLRRDPQRRRRSMQRNPRWAGGILVSAAVAVAGAVTGGCRGERIGTKSDAVVAYVALPGAPAPAPAVARAEDAPAPAPAPSEPPPAPAPAAPAEPPPAPAPAPAPTEP